MKLLMYLFILIVSLLSNVCFAQVSKEENRGVSWILQMCSEKTDCSVIETAYKGATVINAGWLYLTSNPNSCKCAPKLLSDPRPKRIRLDVCNSTCFPERGRKCEPQECFAGMTGASASKAVISKDSKTYSRIDKSISLMQKDLDKNKGPLELGIKACLECTLSRDARIKLNDYVKTKFPESKYPGVKFVDNPIGDKCLPGYLCEKHGEPKGGNNLISDNDGLDYDTIDQLKYWVNNVASWMVLGWKQCNNGLDKGESYKPGVQRTNYCGSSRDGKDFASFTVPNAIAVSSPVNEADKKGCKTFYDAPDGVKNFVLKLGDDRNYAVLLTPTNAKINGKSSGTNLSKSTFKKVELFKNGKVIDQSKKAVGKRFGATYDHDSGSTKRKIYDFGGHPNSYPDNSVLHLDDKCFILKKPRFRIDQ